MIDLNYVSGFYPPRFLTNTNFAKHMVKEYIQLMVLDFLSSSPYLPKLAFIGGTNLRLAKGLDRWSEDLDFDCSELTAEEFKDMTDAVVEFLQRNGLHATPKDRDNPKLTAYRRSIYFPQLLFDLNLTGHKEERFLLKMEAQDQGVPYKPLTVDISGCGYFFQFPVPPDDVLLAMKLSALLSRAKGRDFYDTMFLLSRTKPNFDFLKAKTGITSMAELKSAVKEKLATVDLDLKKKDFEHLLFIPSNSDRILKFGDFIQSLPD